MFHPIRAILNRMGYYKVSKVRRLSPDDVSNLRRETYDDFARAALKERPGSTR
jgi:hypothetical protein